MQRRGRRRTTLRHRPVAVQAAVIADGDRPLAELGVVDVDTDERPVHRRLYYRLGLRPLMIDAIEQPGQLEAGRLDVTSEGAGLAESTPCLHAAVASRAM